MQELLDYGKPHDLNPTEVEMRSVVAAAIAQNRHAISRANVDVVIEAPAEATTINVDEGKMQQVFRNLIENAVQHSPAGSTVTVLLHENAWGVVAEVIDHGGGLSPTDMARAFVPFYTRRKGGTGLGLPIVRRIVIAHGGEISLRNGEGGGTVVTVRIPRTALPEVANVRVS
jgi:signal transduction histidine kinase